MNITGIESRQVHSTSMTCYFLDLKKYQSISQRI